MYDDRIAVGAAAAESATAVGQDPSTPAGTQAVELMAGTSAGEAVCSSSGCSLGSSTSVVGRCMLCDQLWDDYSGRNRCR